jgi:hypothetical protein
MGKKKRKRCQCVWRHCGQQESEATQHKGSGDMRLGKQCERVLGPGWPSSACSGRSVVWTVAHRLHSNRTGRVNQCSKHAVSDGVRKIQHPQSPRMALAAYVRESDSREPNCDVLGGCVCSYSTGESTELCSQKKNKTHTSCEVLMTQPHALVTTRTERFIQTHLPTCLHDFVKVMSQRNTRRSHHLIR